MSQTEPIISIIIPVYNTGKYLADCLDSVINQTFSQIEIICVNDGSTDNSADILKTYAARDSRIKIMTQKNSGVISARNNGISRARGEYILCLDSDDKIDKQCLEKLYRTITHKKCAVVIPSVCLFGRAMGISDLGRPTAKNMCSRNRIYSTCGLYKKSFWEKYGGYDKRFANGIEDYDFWMNFIQDKQKIIKIPDVLFFYNVKPENESRDEQTRGYHAELISLLWAKYPIMRKYNTPRKLGNFIYHVSRRRKYFRVVYILKIPVLIIPRTAALSWAKKLVNQLIYPRLMVKMAKYMMNQQLSWRDTFVPLSNRNYKPHADDPKIIAYYLPQFYQFPQNDQWHGRGFTEWTNVTRATPQFIGHYQPHLPIDVGFYNLNDTKIMHRQVELAKQYGIYGFCYYYYWFHGTKLMDKPIKNMLNDKSLDMPFCLFWANEDWTNTWGEAADHGTTKYDAETHPDEAEQFLDDILPYWSDSRYIKIDGRPVLMIYKYKRNMLPEFVKQLKFLCTKRGIPEPFIMMFSDNNPTWNPFDYAADAAAEFNMVMGAPIPPRHPDTRVLNKSAILVKYDIEKWIENRKYMYKTDYPLYRGCMTNFDNTARKIYRGAWHLPMTPELYYKWLRDIIEWTRDYGERGKFVFVSAWNEWAEGMHLEPDQKYGYAYLHETRRALENTRK